MRSSKLLSIVVLAACSGGSDTPQDSGVVADAPTDVPGIAPMITSLIASPSQVQAGVPTSITWTWTYLYPPFPDATCSIDNGVGAIANGQAATITITAPTTFRLTCTNYAGSASYVAIIIIPPTAPQLATFTATPSTVPIGSATSVTWSWTYANVPSPTPTCSIESIGAVTDGAMSTLTQTTSRVYRLRCTNTQGTVYMNTTVNVNECLSAATNDCQANSTCADTPNGFTCACNGGYAATAIGNADTCSVQAQCALTPSLCDTNASCVNTGTVCQCNPGYVGPGNTCQKTRWTFLTSATGTGDLASWSGGTGVGLARADSICQAAATSRGYPGTYVAWMSDFGNDAYCRVHGSGGKKATNCGMQPNLPTGAGPWTRRDGEAAYPTIDRLLSPNLITYRPSNLNELGTLGTEVGVTDRVWTGTDNTGVYVTGSACSDWTTTAGTGAMGEVNGGGISWTDAYTTDPSCLSTGHLRCMEVGSGPALPPRHPVGKKAFLTSVTGNGYLYGWADSNMTSGIFGADAVCQARARAAGYANAQSFEAWMAQSFSYYPSSRIGTAGPWARPDGVIVAPSRTALFSGRLTAPLYVTETGTYVSGNADIGNVWTGATSTGSYTSSYCSSWTSTSSFTYGTVGRFDLADGRWASTTTQSCDNTGQRLYCFED